MNKTSIMGILNITPDSFYDGNEEFLNNNKLKEKIKDFKNADIIDIGCESSRPGSISIGVKEELNRLRLVEKISFNNKKTISIDSYKPEVIEYCLNNGFNMINDISGGGTNFKNIDLAKKYSASIVLMHMKGNPYDMQIEPKYNNVIDDLNEFFYERIKYSESINYSKNNIILDPGIGFGKTIQHNDQILLNLNEFKHFNCKILIGISRKSFLSIDFDEPSDRLEQSIGVGALSAFFGADIIRVHDVNKTYKMLKIINRLKSYG